MQTQCDRILEVLKARHGQWVPMPDLAEASGAYAVHSRIANLRERGLVIENRTVGQRPKLSYYRLVSPIQESLL